MSLWILASLIIFGLTIKYSARSSRRKYEKDEADFWERERRSNFVRKKSLDNLDYIQVPLSRLPLDALPDTEKGRELRELFPTLATQNIVNFTGMTNTDLKLEYGTANITKLSEFDQNYTVLVRSLQQCAELLLEENRTSEAKAFLEYAVEIHTDLSHTYYSLAKLYHEEGDDAEIAHLMEVADALPISMHKVIVRTLHETYPEVPTPQSVDAQ